jgi:uncharacterized protein YecE (DUF72 family)
VATADAALDPDELERLRAALPPEVHFGTSSWTYPGWGGLVYHRSYGPKGQAAAMLEEYARFPLFTTVGIDSSFYAPPSGETLARYAAHLPPHFPCVSKVWDQLTVHTVARARDASRAGQQNPDFLRADLFVDAVLEPYQRHFAAHTGPFVFEFQAIRGLDAPAFADQLDAFFSALPREVSYAVEVRNAAFLTPAYFAVLRQHGVAHVFNAWTRMPPIGEQLDLPDVITAPFLVARALLTPGRRYAESVDAFAPFDRIREPAPELRQDLVRLVALASSLRIPVYVLVNNRIEGCAPRTIAAVAALWAARAD